MPSSGRFHADVRQCHGPESGLQTGGAVTVEPTPLRSSHWPSLYGLAAFNDSGHGQSSGHCLPCAPGKPLSPNPRTWESRAGVGIGLPTAMAGESHDAGQTHLRVGRIGHRVGMSHGRAQFGLVSQGRPATVAFASHIRLGPPKRTFPLARSRQDRARQEQLRSSLRRRRRMTRKPSQIPRSCADSAPDGQNAPTPPS